MHVVDVILQRAELGALGRSPGSRAFITGTLAHHVALGIPYTVWNRKQVAALGWDTRAFGPARTINDPHFGEANPDPSYAIEGAVMFPVNGFVQDPQLAVQNLKTVGAAAGVTHVLNADVTRVLQSDDWAEDADEGEDEA